VALLALLDQPNFWWNLSFNEAPTEFTHQSYFEFHGGEHRLNHIHVGWLQSLSKQLTHIGGLDPEDHGASLDSYIALGFVRPASQLREITELTLLLDLLEAVESSDLILKLFRLHIFFFKLYVCLYAPILKDKSKDDTTYFGHFGPVGLTLDRIGHPRFVSFMLFPSEEVIINFWSSTLEKTSMTDEEHICFFLIYHSGARLKGQDRGFS
jgi:hypothetical protein